MKQLREIAIEHSDLASIQSDFASAVYNAMCTAHELHDTRALEQGLSELRLLQNNNRHLASVSKLLVFGLSDSAIDAYEANLPARALKLLDEVRRIRNFHPTDSVLLGELAKTLTNGVIAAKHRGAGEALRNLLEELRELHEENLEDGEVREGFAKALEIAIALAGDDNDTVEEKALTEEFGVVMSRRSGKISRVEEECSDRECG